MLNKDSISIIIPAHNEEKLIKNTLCELDDYLSSLKSLSDYEIIIVINNSIDKTEEICREFIKKKSNIRIIVTKEKGVGFAIREGFKQITKNITTFLPADGEIEPYFIDEAIMLMKNHEFINCTRYKNCGFSGSSFLRKFLSYSFSKTVRYTISTQLSEVGTIKIFKSDWIKNLAPHLKKNDWSFQIELLYYVFKDNLKMIELPIHIRNQRPVNESTVKIIPTTISFLLACIYYGIKIKKIFLKNYLLKYY